MLDLARSADTPAPRRTSRGAGPDALGSCRIWARSPMQMTTATRASAQPTTAIERRSTAIEQPSSATYAPASVKNSPAGTMVVRKETSVATPRTIGWQQCSTARLPRTAAKRHAKHRHSNRVRLTQAARSITPADRPTATVDTLQTDRLAA